MLAVALIAFIGTISVPVLTSLVFKNDLDTASIQYTQALERSRELAKAVEGDSKWGVKISTGIITLYKGNSFTTRDPNFDEKSFFSDTIEITGINEINFSKLSGDPSLSGATNLKSVNNETRIININEKGLAK